MKKNYLLLIVIAALASLACTTKVSEWVLLNSDPDKYLLVFFHKGEISDLEKQQHRELEKIIKPANIVMKTFEREDIESSGYALYYNNQPVAEYTDYKMLSNIASSPLREKVASELMQGKLSVFFYLKSGNSEKDERGLQLIKKTLAASPFGEVITVLDLDRNSEEEKHLVSMLLSVEDDLKGIQEPMLFGIFGRFRALEPLLANGISEDNITLMIDFLTADCSCLIKDALPGRSILYDGSWENPQTALVNKIMDENPELNHH